MNRLQAQHQRLYRLPAGAGDGVRALVMALHAPADWSELSPVWRGVQADLELPAPGIAVNGEDALELWFSLAEPVSAAQGRAFLQGLQQRYLGGTKPSRVRLMTGADAGVTERIPPLQTGDERWSAFVAADLAAVFAESPSLDVPPGADAQAEQLAGLASIPVPAFHEALQRLQPAAPPAAAPQPEPSAAPAGRPGTVLDRRGPYRDPRDFLRDVMNDPGVALPLRMEAARALLPFTGP
jgi:hypothetical protein